MIPSKYRRSTVRALLVAASLTAALPATPAPVHAQDWSVQGGDARRQEIIARYKTMLESNPVEGMAFGRLLEYAGRGRGLDALIDEYKKRVERQPERANLRLVLGHFLRTRGDYEEALTHYERAVELAPKDPLGWLSRGKVQMLMGKRVEATADFERALELERSRERQQEILRQLADLSFMQRDFERAEKYFDRLVEMEPRNTYLRMEYAQALIEHRRYEKALAQYEVILRLAGNNRSTRATTLRDMAEVYEQMGQDDRALETYQKVFPLVQRSSWLAREVEGRIVNLYRRQDRLPEFLDTFAKGWATGSDFERLMVVGDIYQELGRIDEALAVYRRASSRNSRSVDPRIKIIRILERRGQDAEVAAAYRSLISVAPTRYQYQFDLVRHYVRMGDRKAAERLLGEIDRRFARDSHVQVQLADQYVRLEMSARALAIYERLVRQEPKNEVFILSLGEFYYQNGERQKAVETWARLVDSELGRVEGHARFGELLVDRGMVDQGIGHFEKAVELAPDDMRILRGLAQSYERARRWEQAIEAWTRVLDGAPMPHMAAEARSRILEVYRRQNRLRAKMREFAASFEASPPDLRAGYFLAESHLKLQEVEQAEAAYERLLELERESGAPGVDALLALEKLYVQRGDLERAIAMLEQLAELMPDMARDFYQRMAEHALRLRSDEQAVHYASRALEQNPDDAVAQARLGEVYQGMGDVEAAIRQYRTAIDLDPRAYALYVKLAELLRLQGEVAEAERLYRTVMRQSPDDALVTEVARKAMELAMARGGLDEIENELHPMLYRNPPRPVYRRLLLELYGRQASPLVAASRYGKGAQREAAFEALERIGARAMPVLLDALTDNDIGQRVTAVNMLVDFGQRNAAPSIARLVEDPSEALRVPAAIAAARLGDERAAPSLIRALDDTEAGIRNVATWALGFVGGKQATVRLIEALGEGENVTQQILATVSLGRIGTPQANDALLGALERVQASAYTDPSALAVVWALGEGRDERAVGPLTQVMHEAGESLAAVAASALARIGHGEAIEALVAAQWSDTGQLRQIAGTALVQAAARHGADAQRERLARVLSETRLIDARRGTIRADQLVTALEQEARAVAPVEPAEFIAAHGATFARVGAEQLANSPQTAALVATDLVVSGEVAGEVHDGIGLGPLTALAPADAEAAARREQALATIADGLRPALRKRVQEDGDRVGAEVVALVGVMGEAEDVRALSGLAGHADPAIRARVLLALARLGAEGDVQALQRAALDDEDYRVRAAAATSLGRSFALGVRPDGPTVARLEALAGERYRSVRLAAIEALGRSGSPEAVAALDRLIGNAPRDLQGALFAALENIASDAAREAQSRHEDLRGLRMRGARRP